MLSFGGMEFTDYLSRSFPLNSNFPPLIAPFWYDLNPQRGGNISYRQTNDSITLQDVHSLLSGLDDVTEFSDFYPTSLFIATWYQVEPIDGPIGVICVLLTHMQLGSF